MQEEVVLVIARTVGERVEVLVDAGPHLPRSPLVPGEHAAETAFTLASSRTRAPNAFFGFRRIKPSDATSRELWFQTSPIDDGASFAGDGTWLEAREAYARLPAAESAQLKRLLEDGV